MEHVINHCGLRNEMQQKQMTREDFMERVLQRAGQIIDDVVENRTGEEKSNPSEYAGVEITAIAVANHVLDEGAGKIAADMGTSLQVLKEQASAAHISSC